MMPFFEILGVNYHVQIQGSGTPIVFLHGFTGCAANWQPIINILPSQYWTIAIDLLGHGETDSPAAATRYRMEHAAEDLASLIEMVVNQPVHLVGYSMGGRLALYFAIHYPQWLTRLTLESASPGLADPVECEARRRSDEQLARRMVQNGITEFVTEWENLPLFASQQSLSEDVRTELRQQRLQNKPHGLANSLRGMGTGAQPSLWEQLGQITLPTTLIAGSLDHKFGMIARQMGELIPHARVITVPHAGHTVHLEQPSLFTQALIPPW
jgi:2-succinyl-6-hydroxy-2,4-cyclohexadiene-1-carboxylate synthase